MTLPEGLKNLREEARELRKRNATVENAWHIQTLLRLLWFGLVDRAIDYLQAVPASELKNHKPIERLTRAIRSSAATTW